MWNIAKSTGKMLVSISWTAKISIKLKEFDILCLTSMLCIFFSYKVYPNKGKFFIKTNQQQHIALPVTLILRYVYNPALL